MKIASVVPFIRLPRGIDFFDYSVPDHLADSLTKGCRVVIPFRSKMNDGIVWSIGEKNDGRPLKELREVIHNSPPLSREIMDILDWAAQYYACSRSLFLPLSAGKRLKRRKTPDTSLQLLNKEPMESQQKLFQSSGISVIRWTDYVWRDAFLKKTAKEHLKNGHQLMILCPTLKRSAEVAGMLEKIAKNKMVHLTSGLSVSKEVALREKLMCGAAQIAVGTRMLVFADMQNLSTIIIDKAHRDEHAQYDMNPRYDARTVAYKRAQGAKKLIIMSPAPRMEDWHEVKSGRAYLQEHLAALPSISLVNLQDAWRGGLQGFISDPLAEASRACLLRGKDVLIVTNKKGYASHMVCRDCEWVFICKACLTPLPGTKNNLRITCRTCTSVSDVPSCCPSCKSVRLLLPGIGSEKIAEQVRTLFPSVACLEISSDTLASAKVAEYLSGTSTKPTIIIGTALVPQEYGHLFKRFGVIAMLAADAIPSRLNFRAHEHQWRLLAAMSLLAAKNSCLFFIQAFNHLSPFIQDIAKNAYNHFADSTLIERKKFSWPPFGKCIVIIPKQGKSRKKELIGNVIRNMRETVRNDMLQLHVLDRGKPSERLLVRLPSWSLTTLPVQTTEILSCIPPEWLVDTDPISL